MSNLATNLAGSNPVTLVDQATIAFDSTLSTLFRVTLAGNRTLAAPSNPIDGRGITLAITQDAIGSRTLTLPSGAYGFSFGTDVPSSSYVLSTSPGMTDYLSLVYRAAAQRWNVVGFVRGFVSDFQGADSISDANYYTLASPDGTRGTAGTGILTAHAWVVLKTTTTSQVRYILGCEAGSGWEVITSNTNSTLTFRSRGAAIKDAVVTSVPSSWRDRWLHVAGVIDGTNVILYVDGAQAAITSLSGNYAVSTQDIQIGRRPGTAGSSVAGDVRVAGFASGNYAATLAQIAAAHTSGLAAKDVIAIPNGDEHMYSFAQDGGCNAQLLDRIGTAHMTRVGAPVYVV